MSITKTYLIIYEPLRSITTVFMDENAIIDAILNPTRAKKYIFGFAEFVDWYNRAVRHRFGNVAVTEYGHHILSWNGRSWLMIEASDMFDAVKKAEPILHERIKY